MNAVSRALNYLARRSRTEQEIRTYLKDKGHHEAEINQCIEKLKHYQYLDDHRTAREFVAYRERSKPMGRFRLKRELQSRGVTQAIIEEVLAEFDGEKELALARQAIANKNFTSQQKLTRYLLYRGFSYEQAAKIWRDEFARND